MFARRALTCTALALRWTAVLACWTAGGVRADESRDAAVIEELLKVPAPAPDWRVQLAQPEFAKLIGERPADDAPLEELAEFWLSAPEQAAPSPGLRARLLEAGETHPEMLPGLLRWMPEDAPEVHDRIKALYDRLASGGDPQAPVSPIREWLMLHSRYFRDELLAETRKDFAAGFDPAIETDVHALARLDERAAESLLLSLAESSDAHTHATALRWLHELRAAKGDPRAAAWQEELQRIAAETTAPPAARACAIVGLMKTPWAGQEEWFLGLFHDASLGKMSDGLEGGIPLPDSTPAPLCTVTSENPDRWIPKLVALLGSPDRAIHNNAAHCLSEFHLERARADALRPLLPWLSDPQWAEVEGLGRLRLVQSLDRVDLPESVPGLIWVLEHEHEFLVSGAAEALRHYGAKEAGSALKDAVDRETDQFNHRRIVAQVALALGAYSQEEMVRSLEAYAVKLTTEEGRQELKGANEIIPEGKLASEVVVGKEVAGLSAPPAGVGALVQLRCDEIAAQQPAVADAMRTIVTKWPGAAAAGIVEQRLKAGDFTRPWLEEVIERRKDIAAEVRKIADLHGMARGVQAAVCGEGLEAVLRGDDRMATLALLACARLARISLSLEAVEPLSERDDEMLRRAGELYLVSEDSPRARAAVLRHYPGQARILGPGYNFDPRHEEYGLGAAEGRLRRWFHEDNPPQEIFALLSSGTWGGDSDRVVIVRPGEIAFVQFDGTGRHRKRIMAPGELEKLRSWLASHRADELAPFDQGAMDGVQYEYVHVTTNGGRRVFMNNPPGGSHGAAAFFPGGHQKDPDARIYGHLVGQFASLEAAPMEVLYDTLRGLPGFQLLHAREQGEAGTLIVDGNRALVETTPRQEPDHATWQMVDDHGFSNARTDPPAWVRRQFDTGQRHDFRVESRWVIGPCTGRLAASQVWPGTREKDDVDGLWIEPEKGEPRLLAHGRFGMPVATPDGEWIVVAKCLGKSWAEPNGVVRIHVADGQESAVDLPSADEFDAVAWIGVHGKVLVRRAKDEPAPGIEPKFGPLQAEFHLLDPATGNLDKVTGDFAPLLQETTGPNPPTPPGEVVWVASPSPLDEEPRTVVGRYDLRKFALAPALKIEGVRFGTADMWVNESAGNVTFIVNGDVLRLSLP